MSSSIRVYCEGVDRRTRDAPCVTSPSPRMNTARGLRSPKGNACLRWQVRPEIDGLEHNLGRRRICQLRDAFDVFRKLHARLRANRLANRARYASRLAEGRHGRPAPFDERPSAAVISVDSLSEISSSISRFHCSASTSSCSASSD